MSRFLTIEETRAIAEELSQYLFAEEQEFFISGFQAAIEYLQAREEAKRKFKNVNARGIMKNTPTTFINFLKQLTEEEAKEFFDWTCSMYGDILQDEIMILIQDRATNKVES